MSNPEGSRLQRMLSEKEQKRKTGDSSQYNSGDYVEEEKQDESAYAGTTMAGSTMKQTRYPAGHNRSGSKAGNFLMNQELTEAEQNQQAQTMPRQSREARNSQNYESPEEQDEDGTDQMEDDDEMELSPSERGKIDQRPSTISLKQRRSIKE
jgi:hypothetical protein